MGNYVRMRLGGKVHISHARGPVGAHVELVGVHTVAAQLEVGDTVSAQTVANPGIGAGTQIGADIEDTTGFTGQNLAVAGDSGLEVDIRLEPWAVQGEGLFPGVDQFDRLAGLDGQHRWKAF